jgi:hypothetical protein
MAKSREERAAYMREYYRQHPEKFGQRTAEQRAVYNARRRELYAAEPERRERAKRQAREWAKKKPRGKKAQRIRKYGLTLAQFDAMLKNQGGGCAICGHSDMSDPKVFPIVDHNHETGAVRGLLCAPCNKGLGLFRDCVYTLFAAANYVQETC